MKNDAMRRRAGGVKLSSIIFCVTVLVAGLPARGRAQVNSGSNGSDGALNPTTNILINMADHPNGIYQYTSVNIPAGVTVTFTPNANNTPVVWLVQSGVVIDGIVSMNGAYGANGSGGAGGPGGFGGGNGGTSPSGGKGPGGGAPGTNTVGQSGSYEYGNVFIIPLVGGSGGGGNNYGAGGGGGGGAVLIAASGELRVNGQITSDSGCGEASYYRGGDGSGGAIRLVASRVAGSGTILAWNQCSGGGTGRTRIDTVDFSFGGQILGPYTRGYQPIIIPTAGQGAQLTISSIAGVGVSASPSGVLAVPDAVISAQQGNPIPVVVSCSNVALNTAITVSVRPASGSTVTAVGHNTSGTQPSSTATVWINIPRGGGIIYATAATGS